MGVSGIDQRFVPPRALFRMSEFAMQMFDKAKKKAAMVGVKRSSQRLEDEEEGSDIGLPFAPPPERREGALSIPKVAGAILATVCIAALVSALFSSGGGGSKPARAPSSTSGSSAKPGSMGSAKPGSTPPSSSDSEAVETPTSPGNNNGTSGTDMAGGQKSQVLPAASLEEKVDSKHIRVHLERLYTIALENGGNRAMGNSGYNASVQYVLSTLATMPGLSVSVHDFVVNKNTV